MALRDAKPEASNRTNFRKAAREKSIEEWRTRTIRSVDLARSQPKGRICSDDPRYRLATFGVWRRRRRSLVFPQSCRVMRVVIIGGVRFRREDLLGGVDGGRGGG